MRGNAAQMQSEHVQTICLTFPYAAQDTSYQSHRQAHRHQDESHMPIVCTHELCALQLLGQQIRHSHQQAKTY